MKRSLRTEAALLLLFIILCTVGCGTERKPAASASTPGKDAVVSISAVGDIFLTDDVLEKAKQADGSYSFLPEFSEVCAALAKADLTIGNLEGTFSGAPYGRENGSYPDELAATLNGVGFDILQTANSFSIYNGLTALQRTKKVIEENGMLALGTYSTEKEHSDNRVKLLEINGVRIAVLAMTKGFGGMSLPAGEEYCADTLYTDYNTDYEKVDETKILNLLDEAKAKQPDLLIACLHWGSENVTEVSRTQEQIADLMFHNGVDVILGAHSHELGKVEQRSVRLDDGSRKNVLIAYSLGDFCSVEGKGTSVSPILNMEFIRKASTGKTELSKLNVTTVVSMYRSTESDDEEVLPMEEYVICDADTLISLYESNYYNRISKDLYTTLLQKRERLRSAMGFDSDTP